MIDESDKKQLLLDYNDLQDIMHVGSWDDLDRLLKYGTVGIREFCAKYGVDNSIQYLKQMMPHIGPEEWLSFAMAGIAEVEPELRSHMNLKDPDIVSAALGLAYLGFQDGFDAIINSIKIETTKPAKDIQKLFIFTPVGPVEKAWDLLEFKQHLIIMPDPRAAAILNDYVFFFKKSF